AFTQANWNARKLFATGSSLNLTEGQFSALTDADREAKANDLQGQVETLRQLEGVVADAAPKAAANGDTAKAKKYFLAIKQCGMSLQNADRLALLQIVGQGFDRCAR